MASWVLWLVKTRGNAEQLGRDVNLLPCLGGTLEQALQPVQPGD